MRVFITGCNSYLGGWVTELLEERSDLVYGEDSHGSLYYFKQKNEWTKKDKHDVGLLGAQAIVLLGWYSKAGSDHPNLQLESQERTIALLERIEKISSIKQIVFVSSAAVYGDMANRIVNENSPVSPNCHYSNAKHHVEQYILNQPSLVNRSTILRIGSLMGIGAVGWRSKTELIVNAFAVDGYQRQSVTCWNPFDYKPILHVQDAAEIIKFAVHRNLSPGIYNVCEGSYQAQELAKAIAQITNPKSKVEETVKLVHSTESIHKSCMMDCAKLKSVYTKKLKTYFMATKEFEYFIESPDNRNIPWIQAKELI